MSGASHTSQTGDAVFTYSGQPKPLLTSSSQTVAVLGQAGATFSTVTLEPPPNLVDTYITYERYVNGQYEIYAISPVNGATQLLYHSVTGGWNTAISAYGTIAFESVAGGEFTIRPDGSGLKPLSVTGISQPLDLSFAYDGSNRVAFNSSIYLYTSAGTGGTPTEIESGGYASAWSPSGSQIAFQGTTGTNANTDMYLAASSGGARTDITPTALRNTGVNAPLSWNADGVTLLEQYEAAPDGNYVLALTNTTNPSFYENITPSGDADLSGAFSPDGSKIAILRSASNSATPGIYISDAAGYSQQLLLQDDGTVTGNLSWSPFLPKETVVGASGSTFYHQASSGFLLSQVGPAFGSFVAFTANTPSTAAIQAPTASSTYAQMVFTVTADSITQFAYTNSYFSPGTSISLTSTPTVVVSIDALTGQVDMVAPAATKPSATMNGDGTLSYAGSFKAIYDGTGKNLAPGGAVRLVLNSTTGKLVSFK